MSNNFNFTYNASGFSKLVWGLLLVLAAAFIIANQVGGFVEIGFWSILVGTLAAAYTIACLIELKIGSLPIPLAILYLVLQTPLDLPHIGTWWLILAAVIASIGLHIILPKRKRNFKKVHTTKYGHIGEFDDDDDDDDFDADIEIDLDGEDYVKRDDYDNNPRVSVRFGGESRYLYADALETADLDCKFGGLEVYFDNAKLSPKGAMVYCDVKFGGMELYIPKEWRVKDNFSVALGAAEKGRRREAPAPDAPLLTIKGNVAFGAIEIHYI